MLKKDITYTNYNGQTVTEPFYFNISPADLIDMEVEASDYNTPDEKGDTGYKAMINAIIKSEDTKALMKVFKDLISRSYGVKTADGKHFYKGEDVFREFSSTEAYSALMLDLLGNTENAVNFVKGVFPNAKELDFEVVPDTFEVVPDTSNE